MTHPKINLTHLKQYLKNCSQEELISDITELFKQFPSVKDYYQIKLNPQDEKEIAAKYKKIIENHLSQVKAFLRVGHFWNVFETAPTIVGKLIAQKRCILLS